MSTPFDLIETLTGFDISIQLLTEQQKGQISSAERVAICSLYNLVCNRISNKLDISNDPNVQQELKEQIGELLDNFARVIIAMTESIEKQHDTWIHMNHIKLSSEPFTIILERNSRPTVDHTVGQSNSTTVSNE